MSPPVSNTHGEAQGTITYLLKRYAQATPGVSCGSNTSVRLDGKNEYQPEVLLRIESAQLARSRVAPDGLLDGGPEFLAEIAVSSAAYDLHEKKAVYQRCLVPEYFVWQVMDSQIQAVDAKAAWTWNNLRFRSASETKIAAALDKVQGVWFLPNCRGRVGAPEDRKNREADFLVCHKGKWGILEPQNRYSSTRCRCRRERERNLPKSCWPAWKRRLGLPKSRLPAIGKPWNDARPPTKANSSKRRRRMCPTTQIEKLGEAGRLPPMRTEIQSRRHSPKKSEKIAANPRVLADLQ